MLIDRDLTGRCNRSFALLSGARMSLFQAAAAHRSLQSGPKPLVSFRCGLINSDAIPGDSTKLRMRADPRKGELRLMRSFDGVLTLEWRDRTTGNPIHSWMVFPGDISFKRIKTGRDGDRVFELKFTAAGDNRRFFFWMQKGEAAAASAAPTEGASASAAGASSALQEDIDNAKKLLELINNPQAAQQAANANAAAGSGGTAGGRAGGRGAAGGGAGGAVGGGALTQEQLAAMLSAMVSRRRAAESCS